MNLNVLEEKDNPLFKRKEIIASVDYQGGATPSKAVMQKAIAEQYKVGADSVEIEKLLSEVGMTKGKAWIKIWQEKKVPIYTEKKAKEEAPAEAPKEEAKAEETPKEEPKKEEPKEEKPAEEKKEEPKAEEKKE